MKKPVAFLMACLALAASLSCAFAEAETNHILWDIPWGVSHEDFCAQVLEKTGIVFTCNQDDVSIPNFFCYADPQAQDITIMGQKVDHLSSFFSREEGYSSTNISFYGITPIPLQDSLPQLEALYLQLQALYGPPTYKKMRLLTAGESLSTSYAVPFRNDTIDFDRVHNLFGEHTTSILDIAFHNVRLSFVSTFPINEPGMELCQFSLTFRKEIDTDVQNAMDAGTVYPSYDDIFATPSPLPAVDVGL